MGKEKGRGRGRNRNRNRNRMIENVCWISVQSQERLEVANGRGRYVAYSGAKWKKEKIERHKSKRRGKKRNKGVIE